MLRGIFGVKRDGVIGDCRKLHIDELNDLYCSPNTVRLIKSRIKWAGHVERIGERRVQGFGGET
jgi:predicted transcriptional regulator of viral defense system